MANKRFHQRVHGEHREKPLKKVPPTQRKHFPVKLNKGTDAYAVYTAGLRKQVATCQRTRDLCFRLPGQAGSSRVMNTTLLFAELLIIGLQAAVWIFLLLLNILGTGWVQTIQSSILVNWQTFLLIILLSVFYVIGVIVDRLADAVFSRWEWKLRRTGFPDPPMPVVVLRFELARGNEHLNHQFEYNRSRMRISRASALNFGLTTLMGVIFILARVQTASLNARLICLLTTVLMGTALTLGAAFTWRKLMRGYFGMLKEYSRVIQPKKVEVNSLKG